MAEIWFKWIFYDFDVGNEKYLKRKHCLSWRFLRYLTWLRDAAANLHIYEYRCDFSTVLLLTQTNNCKYCSVLRFVHTVKDTRFTLSVSIKTSKLHRLCEMVTLHLKAMKTFSTISQTHVTDTHIHTGTIETETYKHINIYNDMMCVLLRDIPLYFVAYAKRLKSKTNHIWCDARFHRTNVCMRMCVCVCVPECVCICIPKCVWISMVCISLCRCISVLSVIEKKYFKKSEKYE